MQAKLSEEFAGLASSKIESAAKFAYTQKCKGAQGRSLRLGGSASLR
jgi:hypothetical protein